MRPIRRITQELIEQKSRDQGRHSFSHAHSLFTPGCAAVVLINCGVGERSEHQRSEAAILTSHGIGKGNRTFEEFL
jgi:hypothetical protein